MGSTTADKGLPFPVGTDRVMDGDNAIQALAQATDYAIQSGQVTMNTVADTNVIIPVVFTHAFAAPPAVIVGSISGPPASGYTNLYWAQAITAAGFSVGGKRSNAVAVQVHWVAVGKPA